MEISRKHKHLKNMIALSFLLNVVSGIIGSAGLPVGPQHFMWALGAFFMIVGASLLGSKLTRDGHDIPAAGFIVLSIAQAMSYGFIATHDSGREQFGAVASIFVPALILISFYNVVPVLFRIAGFISAASFAIFAFVIYGDLNTEAISSMLILSGFITMNIATLGWAWLIYKNKI